MTYSIFQLYPPSGPIYPPLLSSARRRVAYWPKIIDLSWPIHLVQIPSPCCGLWGDLHSGGCPPFLSHLDCIWQSAIGSYHWTAYQQPGGCFFMLWVHQRAPWSISRWIQGKPCSQNSTEHRGVDGTLSCSLHTVLMGLVGFNVHTFLCSYNPLPGSVISWVVLM